MECFTPLKLLINEVFNTFKYQLWVRRPSPIQHNPSLPVSEKHCSYYEGKIYQTIHSWALQKYLEELVKQGFFKKYILTPEVVCGHPSTQSSRE